MKQYHINLLSSELRQLMLATQESERKVICQAEAAGKLGGILQFSTCESYFVFWRELMSDQAQPFSTHYISCIESLVKPYQSKRNVYKLLFWRGRNGWQLFRVRDSALHFSVELKLVPHSFIFPPHHSLLLVLYQLQLPYKHFMQHVNRICKHHCRYFQLCRQVTINPDECGELWMFTGNFLCWYVSESCSRDWLKVFFPYLCLRPALCIQMQDGLFFQFHNCIIIV